MASMRMSREFACPSDKDARVVGTRVGTCGWGAKGAMCSFAGMKGKKLYASVARLTPIETASLSPSALSRTVSASSTLQRLFSPLGLHGSCTAPAGSPERVLLECDQWRNPRRTAAHRFLLLR
jgi:hypothetical protein